MLKLYRLAHWWSVIPPQILGWMFFCELIGGVFLITDPLKPILFFGGVIFIAAFGYLFNDYCDVSSDNAAGKPNLLSSFHPTAKIVMIIAPLAAGAVCWWLTASSPVAKLLYLLQVIALILYSAFPFRFKERGIWGVFADAFYGHINPALFTLATFYPVSFFDKYFLFLFLPTLLICTIAKGVRNILLHQLADRKHDKRSGIITLVTTYGPLKILYFINRILRYETIVTLLLALLICIRIPPFMPVLLFYVAITYLKFSGWKLSYLPSRQLKFKFLHFLNDFFEQWLPTGLIIILLVRDIRYLAITVAYIVLFPQLARQLKIDLSIIIENFKSEEDY